jgi:hypothetical protein
MTDEIVVKPVIDPTSRNDFLRVPYTAFEGNRTWIAPLWVERKDHIDPKKNPYFQHAEVQLFVAYRAGKPVGRISAQDDALRISTHKDNTGMFGFLDAVDDINVFQHLINAAAHWLSSRGRPRMVGPFNFSINDELGVLIDGFDTPPNMMMAHGQPYTSKHLETLGLRKAKDMIAYHYNLGPSSELFGKVRKRALASGDFELRPLNLSQMKNEIMIIKDIFNDAWSNNWGFVPWTQSELDKLGQDLKLLINRNYGYIAAYKGEPAAFVVTLPNINSWIKNMNGALLPFNWLILLNHVIRKRPTSLRMPLMGVKKKFHNTAVGSALSILTIDAARNYHISRGAKSAELSWILEDNLPVRRLIEAYGATPYKTYRIYEKAL